MHFMASIHFTWLLWEILLHMTSTTPLITFCKPTPPARHWSLSQQISPSGRGRRKVKSSCTECADLWSLLASAHLSECVCVTVCDSKGLTKECMKSAAGTSDNWAICCKVTAEQPLCHQQPRPESGFCNISKCVRKWYGRVLIISPSPSLIYSGGAAGNIKCMIFSGKDISDRTAHVQKRLFLRWVSVKSLLWCIKWQHGVENQIFYLWKKCWEILLWNSTYPYVVFLL